MTQTKIKPEIQVDIRPTGIESATFYAPFDQALETLTEKGCEVISLPQNAQLRIQQGKDSYVSRIGNYTREGVLYFPNGKPKLVRNSPILLSAREATQAHRERKDFYPTQAQIEQALQDSFDFPQEDTEIPTNRFGENELTRYAFEDVAEQYGQFLRESGIETMPILVIDRDLVNKKSQPFARQIWFGELGSGRSALSGNYGRILTYSILRGVKEK